MVRSKVKLAKKNQKKRSILFQIIIGIIFVSFALYLILTKVISKSTDSTSNDLNTAMNNKTAYSFVKEGELTFIDSQSEYISGIEIEIADDNDQRATGLMFRNKLAENQGMLFIFPTETLQSFWMKNTILSLDIIFVNSKMEIVKIHKNTTPYSEQSYPSLKPAQYVVEVIAGYCDKHNVKEGDKIVWRRD
jgi:uncharacterized membrane protein (UPF0127 family)